MTFFNSWRSHKRNWDKIDLTIRVSSLTIISVKADLSRRYYRINILNLGIKSK